MITVKFQGGPKDNTIMVLYGDPVEYRFKEHKHFSIESEPEFLVSIVDHIYKKSESDPHIFWYAGSEEEPE